MADTKISDLAAITALDGTEEFVVADTGTTKKITSANALKAAHVPVADSGGNYTADDVEGVLAEIAPLCGGTTPVHVFATLGYTVVQGTWVRSIDTQQPFATYLNSTSDAQNDEITYQVGLAAGTYKVLMSYVKVSNGGIYTLALDGSSFGTVDGYAAGNTFNQYSEITGVVVATSGVKTLSVKMATKNASSSAYRGIFTVINFMRTA